ncbi:NADP-dependent oxidoreductase [Streptomyces acidicola]|uniref:NADP-dependent oxidoreductase n=1 Tax=Streptomyces acidicola TaxID=2596892 RepID=A0A5N8WZD5_9ACTN|nr:NADP-dependent oxidoreductase [Streptomyces acidicola]MPY52432.1 NADP-dependent oxidoreductase [Streptomyces acidicola]
MTGANRQFRLKTRPAGPFEDSDFELLQTHIPVPGDGEFLVKVTHLPIDPAMRGWMKAEHVTPVDVGAVMRAIAIGQVVHSSHPGFAEGDFVHGTFGVQEFALSDGTGVYKVHPEEGRSLAAYLGVLGMTGMTAYFGLLDVGRLAAGDVVLVSGAAGAVGSVAGQIAKIKGAHVIGIAGGPEKTRMLVDRLGFSAAIDYKRDDFLDQLRDLTPRYVDVFFDNVGGDILNQALTRLARGARVVISGAISQYDNAYTVVGPSNYLTLLYQSASMAAVVAPAFADRYPEAMAQMSHWLADGRLTSIEDTVHGGIETFPATLRRLFTGKNTGKLVLELELQA